MNRIQEVFGVQRVLLPVIHPVSHDIAMASVKTAVESKCPGVFLINQGMNNKKVLALVMAVRMQYPKLWVGINLLGISPIETLDHCLTSCDGRIDGIWTDNAKINEDVALQTEAQEFVNMRRARNWDGLYFGGVAFKYQREVESNKLNLATRAALPFMDVICTSGPGTAQEAPVHKVAAMRDGITTAIALASGITEDNVMGFLPYVDAYLVGTSIERDFGILDPDKVNRLQQLISSYLPKHQDSMML